MHRRFTILAKRRPHAPVRRRAILGLAAVAGCALVGPAAAQDAPAGAPRLELSPAQRQLIHAAISRLTHLSTAAPETFGAAVGGTVPPSVELTQFPEALVEVVPQTRGYAFAFVAGQVLIVEPRARRIVEVITRS